MTHINFIYNTSTLTSHLHRLHPSLTQSTPEVWHRNCDTGVVILDLLQSYTGIVTVHRSGYTGGSFVFTQEL